jgi:hypothetical protein
MQNFSKQPSPLAFEDLTPEQQDYFREEYERTQLQIVPATQTEADADKEVVGLDIPNLPPMKIPVRRDNTKWNNN